MNNEVYYLISQKQLNRFVVITKVIDGHISIEEAVTSLALRERQIKRLKKGVKAKGAAFLIRGNCIIPIKVIHKRIYFQ